MNNFLKKSVVVGFFAFGSPFFLLATSTLASNLVECYLSKQCREGAQQTAFTATPEMRAVSVFRNVVEALMTIIAEPRARKKAAKEGSLDRVVAAQLNAQLINNSVSDVEQRLILHHLKRFFSPRMLGLLYQEIKALEWDEAMLIAWDCLECHKLRVTERIVYLIHTLHLYSRQCAICLESFARQNVLTVLPCSHYYHADCIGSDGSMIPFYEPDEGPGLQPHRRCPLCRAAFVGGARVMRL